jgi:glycosyltransferase involved in cell wall biosynthesis
MDKEEGDNAAQKEVIYLINADFAFPGTGFTAYNAVRGTYRHGLLKRVIVKHYRESEIDSRLIKKPMPYGRQFTKILNGIRFYVSHDFQSQYVSDLFFDRFASRYVDKCDIFHSWTFPIKCIEKAKNTGAVIVGEGASSHPLTHSRLLYEESQKYGYPFRPSKRTDGYMKTFFKGMDLTDYVFVPSNFVYQSYLENNVPEEKLVKIPFGVDLQKFTPVKDKKDDVFRAVFVGQIELRKGVQYLLEAWSGLNLKNSELILRGRIHPNAKKIIDSYRQKINLKTPGWGDPKEDYSKSDVFVFPSIEEGSALVSYEAMASGLPIVATFNTGSVARDGIDGFVIPIRNIDILAEKIRYFYDNPEEAKRMGTNARQNIEKYNWNEYEENIVKAYRRISK